MDPYGNGWSVETVLHEVVGFMENNMENFSFILTAFLDIEGAFNNVNMLAIHNTSALNLFRLNRLTEC